jgi:hypothetical protein
MISVYIMKKNKKRWVHYAKAINQFDCYSICGKLYAGSKNMSFTTDKDKVTCVRCNEILLSSE